ncbi:hypothetical protein WMF18_30190 [Sorangium sp. So ce315]|uniref:hypothetical protein n=1 Tax=Sorangium sp. So ce315 TaxID=3133299 RepID=UPI003F5EFB5D
MITSKMPLRSEDLVNQTALTLPEREMMDVITTTQTGTITQTGTASADDGSNAAVAQAAVVCNQLAVALVLYADYSEADADAAYQDCMADADIDQEVEEEKKKHKKHR